MRIINEFILSWGIRVVVVPFFHGKCSWQRIFKSFAVAILFFLLFLFLVNAFGQTAKKIFRNLSSFVTQEVFDQDQTYFTGHTIKRLRKNCLLYLLFKTRATYDMSYAFQKIIMVEVRRHLQ